MKTLLKVGAVLVVLFIVAVVVVVQNLNSMIKAGVETMGPEITGTTVKLEGVALSLFSGQGEIKGVLVGNPKGFQTTSAFKLADIKVGVDLQSVLSDKIVIREILIDGPEITYESGPSGSNVGKIQQNVAAFSKTPKGPAEAKSQKKDQPQKKIQIDDFIFRNGKVLVSTAMLTGKPFAISLPDIHLKDIGKNSGGVTAETAAAEVFKAIDKSVAQSVSKAAGDMVKSISSDSGKALEGVKGLFGK